MPEAADIRAMILAAGLGTRMRPLSDHRAKPALPVQGRPVISLLLELLARSGVREVLVNLHHLPGTIRDAVEHDHPAELEITWSVEDEPLGTGGGIARAAEFLRGSDDCLVLAGDMLLDVELEALFARHRDSGRDVTVVLCDDPRIDAFGSIGLDARGRVVRIGETRIDAKDAGPEAAAGLFTSVRFFGRDALSDWPSKAGPAFEDLRDWLIPRVESGSLRLGGEIVPPSNCAWEPVGTPDEYLHANLAPPTLPTLGGDAETWRGDVTIAPADGSVVDRSASIARDVALERCVVWDGERVPAGFRGHDGVYAGGTFHSCGGAERAPAGDVASGSAG